MRRCGIRGWLRGSRLLGKPDFVFTKRQVAVFVDGDFWHGNPRRRLPGTNRDYWEAKIEANKKRDRCVNRRLKGMGWLVLRVWESDLRDDPEAVMARLRLMV
jgi:DNA mismatch endonuclease (patch repair protein)